MTEARNEMDGHLRCGCGRSLEAPSDAWGCVECGAPCCSRCAWNLESAAYCPLCALRALHDAFPAALGQGAAVVPKGERRWA